MVSRFVHVEVPIDILKMVCHIKPASSFIYVFDVDINNYVLCNLIIFYLVDS